MAQQQNTILTSSAESAAIKIAVSEIKDRIAEVRKYDIRLVEGGFEIFNSSTGELFGRWTPNERTGFMQGQDDLKSALEHAERVLEIAHKRIDLEELRQKLCILMACVEGVAYALYSGVENKEHSFEGNLACGLQSAFEEFSKSLQGVL